MSQRIELHPATDRWMRGDRYGTVIKSTQMRDGKTVYHVKLDVSGRTVRVPEDLVGRWL